MSQGLPQSIFVTGGAGFIGSHLVDRLLADGHAVTVYDNLSSGRLASIAHHVGKRDFRFVRGDLLDLEALEEAMAGHSLVFHLGANTDIPRGTLEVDLDLRNCTIATHNVLEAMRANGICQLVFSSSGTVYGDPLAIPTPENAGPLLPISLYGSAKLACEALISAYCHLFQMKAWIFRFANVVGKRMEHGVIFDFISKLRDNPNELTILGDGNQDKPFFSVNDCIEGMLCGIKNSDASCDVFNLGCETTTRIDQVARIVAEELGLSDVRFKFTGGRRGWPGDVPQVRLDVTKMRNLGWEASVESDQAVQKAVADLLPEIAGGIGRGL